jgi:hypothetical protein
MSGLGTSELLFAILVADHDVAVGPEYQSATTLAYNPGCHNAIVQKLGGAFLYIGRERKAALY